MEHNYIVEFGIYENSSIMGTQEHTIIASNYKQAREKAEKLAMEIEEEYLFNHNLSYLENGYEQGDIPRVEYWACIEEIRRSE